MSDQYTNGQGWTPPIPQSGTVMAPPPPPPAAGTLATAPGQPAPKKRNVGLIVGIVVGVLMLCGLGSCAVGLAAFGGGADDETISQAEGHYSAATSGISKAADLVKAASDSEDAAAQQSLDEAADALRDARDEVASAKASAEQLDESEGRAAYLDSLGSATATLKSLEDLVAYLGTANGMMSQVERGSGLASRATDDLNAAIHAGNGDSWSKMRAKAIAASSGFAQAALLFSEADKADTSAGLSDAVAYLKKRKAQSDVVVKMADDGRAGRIGSYNKRIKTMRAYGKQAEAIGEPAIVSDPDWASKRLARLLDAVVADSAKADESHGKALKLLGYEGE